MLDAAFVVHTALGPGLLESAYAACLMYELHKAGLDVITEVPVPIVYDGVKLTDVGYRIDMLVANELVIEVKSLEAIAPVHLSQLVSYLKLSDRRFRIVVEFHCRAVARRDLSPGESLLAAGLKAKSDAKDAKGTQRFAKGFVADLCGTWRALRQILLGQKLSGGFDVYPLIGAFPADVELGGGRCGVFEGEGHHLLRRGEVCGV